MITFNYDTYKAEINAMPCLPDEFEIHISQQTVLMNRNNIRVPAFKDYHATEWPGGIHGPGYVLRYNRFQEPKKQPISAQDLILLRLKKPLP